MQKDRARGLPLKSWLEVKRILGVSGKIGSGKTTFAKEVQAVCEERGISVRMINFADRIKTGVSHLFDFPLAWCYTQEGKNNPVAGFDMTVGELLQRFGTEVGRAIDKDVWVKIAMQQAAKAEEDLVIIGDVRFPNEASELSKEHLVIRMHGDPCGIRESSNRDHQHSSETALDKWAWPITDIVDNKDMDMNRLHWQAVGVVKRLFRKDLGKK
jgi:hypothetical protein